jgi:uncharacterized Zn finger protein
MRKNDIACPECNAGFRRIELVSRRGIPGQFRCPVCAQVLEVFDGSKEVGYRLTVAPGLKAARRSGDMNKNTAYPMPTLSRVARVAHSTRTLRERNR